jgi:Autographiviridae endonuclease VII
MKTCARCKAKKPLSEFSERKTGTYRISSWCKECLKFVARKNWHALSPEHKRKRLLVGKNRRLLRMYGISLDELSRLIERQHGRCAICDGVLKENPSIDHCHKQGKVRGILCNPCNVSLGLLKESPDVLERARDYLIAGGIL